MTTTSSADDMLEQISPIESRTRIFPAAQGSRQLMPGGTCVCGKESAHIHTIGTSRPTPSDCEAQTGFLTTTVNLMHVLLQYINKSFNCGWKGPRQTRSLDWRSHSWRETCGPPLRKAELAQVVSDSKSRTISSGTTRRLSYYRLRCGKQRDRSKKLPGTCNGEADVILVAPLKEAVLQEASRSPRQNTVFVAEKIASLRLASQLT